jgi:outer membrane protein OmpA-like peptidoglycan-associated protein
MNQRIHARTIAFLAGSMLLAIAAAAAQDQPAQETEGIPASALTTKTVQAVGFEVGTSTKVNLTPTELAAGAKGTAKVDIKSNASRASVEVDVDDLKPAPSLGAEFLTYVVWVVTPEGRTSNLGELLLNKKNSGKLNATTQAQAFSLIVTAEPYFAVHVPSEMVMLQSEPAKKTKGKIFPVAQYKLMRRAQYEKMGNPLALTLDPKTPLSIYEARNAVEVAKSRGADKFAPEVLTKAEGSLQQMENALNSKDMNAAVADARQTVQFAEDSRLLAVERQEQQRIANEKNEAAARARAEAEAKAAQEAAVAKQKADATAAEAAAEAQRQQEEANAKIAAEAAQRQKLEQEKAQLRARLLEQFNRVLPTTDTPRGLVVNMGDVLFATGKADLNQDAKIALAKLSGIVLNYPSLKLAIAGYTDSTGSADFNQTLSEKRANAVMAYLMGQGLSDASMTAQGYGPNDPVADNNTAAGRQKNRRVEIVISGEVIGTKIGGAAPAGTP